MRFDIAQIAKRQGVKRKRLVLRSIDPPGALGADLAAIELDVIRAWQRGRARIMAEYSRTLSGLQRDDSASLESVVNEVEAEALGIVALIAFRIQTWANRFEGWHRRKWRANLLSSTGVDTEFMLSRDQVRESLESFVRRNVALIRNVSDQAKGKIVDIVLRGAENGTAARTVAAEIRAATGYGRQRSLLIASDQLVKLSSKLDADRIAEAGLDEYEWQHSGKVHFRVNHKARDGKVFKLGEPKGDEPGMAIRCGCKRRPVIRLDK